MKNLFLLGLTLLNYFTILSNADSCTTYTIENDCNRNNLCTWANSKCECASQNSLDVMFVMDSSGSVGASGWQAEKNFVVSMVETGVDSQSRIAVMNFARGAWAQWNFTDSQDRSQIVSHVNAMSWTKGKTYTRTALYAAIAVFDKEGVAFDDKNDLVLFITDGNPWPTDKQLVCEDDQVKDDLDAAGITVIVVGVGQYWTRSAISCLVDNTDTQIIEVQNFTKGAFDQVRGATDAFLCPASVDMTLSEVRVQDHPNETISETESRYVEVYNGGENITLSIQPLIMSGLVEGNITQASGGVIESGVYLVFYDSTLDLPKCYRCPNDTCPDENGDGLCDNAIYISCNGQNDECTMPQDIYNNSYWFLGIQDGLDNSYLVDVTTKKNKPWGPITPGYTYYLEDIFTDSDEVGRNYEMSCFQYGTPGDFPIKDCTGDCRVAQCQSLGDTGASCSGGAEGACECTASKGWYKSGSVCKQIPPPENCKVNTFREDPLDTSDSPGYWQTVEIYWDAVEDQNLDVSYEYDFYDPGQDLDTSDDTTATAVYYYARTQNTMYTSDTDEPKVRALGVTNEGTTVTSLYSNCTIMTSAPTLQPTLSPTDEIPPIEWCTATLQRGSLNVRVEWSEADLEAITHQPENGIEGYYLFYYANGGEQETASITNGELNDIIGLDSYTDPFSSDDLIVSVSAIGYDQYDAIDVDRMESLATNCTLYSPAPTEAPSMEPSGQPSATPSNMPSSMPTNNPTYLDWELSNCVGQIAKGGNSLDLSWNQNDGTSPKREVRLIRNGNEDGFVSSTISETTGTVTAGTSDFGASFRADDTYYLYVEQTDRPNGVDEILDGINCTVSSYAPSLAPSGQPSATPTNVPSGQPSSTPSNYPTVSPTPAPTYQDISVECGFELERQSVAFTVRFTEPDYDTDGIITPLVSESRYLIEWTDGTGSSDSEQTAAVSANSEFSRQVSTNGFDLSQPLTVTIIYGTEGTIAGPTIECNVTTQNPTLSPTTGAPTPAPTYPDPSVYIDIDSIVSDPPCTQSESTGLWSCEVDESESVPTSIDILRDPEVFPFDVVFSWELALEEIGPQPTRRRTLMKGINNLSNLKDIQNNAMNMIKNKEMRRSLLQASTQEPADAFATLDDFDSDTDGETTLDGSTGALENVATVSITLKEENEAEAEGLEKFYFIILSCESSDSASEDDSSSTDSDSSESIYTCSVGVPDRVLINVNDVPGNKFTTSKDKEPLPEWIWYVIGAGVLLLPIVGYFGWRFYNQKKLAEQMEAQRKQDLAEQMALDDAGNFGEIGDAVNFNPLATGGTKDIATGGDYIDKQLQQQKDTFEVAHVDIEQNVFRQDFGPVQTNQRV